MTDLHKPEIETLIEFPCDFELKAMGRYSDDFIDLVFNITQKHAPHITRDDVRLNESKGNKFISVKIKFYATHIEQIHGIYGELNEHPDVLMTL